MASSTYYNVNSPKPAFMSPVKAALLIIVGLLVLFTIMGDFYVVDPGERGVRVTLGTMSDDPIKPGLGLKLPWLTTIKKVSVQQDTEEVPAECFSSDLQQVNVKLKILYRIPESGVVPIVRDYSGDPFQKLILPRVQEAIKEVTSTQTAAEIVKNREMIKTAALQSSQKKIGGILVLDDLVIENVTLSRELEAAIEKKMVQQQEAEQAVYRQKQAQTEAETSVIKAEGEAKSIAVQGAALEKNPKLIELKMVEKWDGVAPQVLGGDAQMLMPLAAKLRRAPTPAPAAP